MHSHLKNMCLFKLKKSSLCRLKINQNSKHAFILGTQVLMVAVSLRHRGGRIQKINAWYLNTHMVYL